MHRLLLLLVILLCTAAVPACVASRPPWHLDSVEGHLPDLSFQLTSDNGKKVTEKDFAGKIDLVYFGYTHCPDVCPLTLAHLHVALQRLGSAADDVHVLFVSVDPARDTPAALYTYVRAFDPHITGLTGEPSEIETLAKRYRAAFDRETPKSDGEYEVSHSSGIYVFDRLGKARLLATSGASVDAIAHDLRLLIREKS
jgi:protein SCO1/2